MLVLKPGYAFVDFDDKGGRKVIAARPADPEKRGEDEEFSYPAADSRLKGQLHKFYPLGDPGASASAHREADNRTTTVAPTAADEAELDELAGDGDLPEDETETEDPLEGLEA
jgi:hypothetical protein